MEKIYVADVPNSNTTMMWLEQNSDWLEAQKLIKPKKPLPDLLTFTIDNFNSVELIQDINEALSIYGDHGWKTSEGELKRYTGFSLVYNPNHIENPDPHSSTLGTPKNSNEQFYFFSPETHNVLKNSYFDTYAFLKPTPASEHKSLGKFMQRCKRTRVRSRLSTIHAKYPFLQSESRRGWHRDESIFANIRINIPITTTPNYFFQMENYNPVHIPVGHAYCWDTHKPHRVCNYVQEDTTRTHLVLGFSPWWDYIPEEQAWVQNEFYGVKHPFDMVIDGDVFEGLHFDPEFSSQLLANSILTT